MVSPLVDLQTRINSNTLTTAQQAAFSEALTVIIPGFPTPGDDGGIADTIPEAVLARDWMAVLYAVVAEGGGGGSGVLPTNQTVWYIDPVNGSNSNDGLTSGTALKTAAYLGSLWRGTAGGGRPELDPATGTTITVNLLNDLPASDPISVLLDVDLAGGMSLVFVGAQKTPAKTSTLTTASTFARTNAGGQQTFTDAGVADFHTFIGTAMLMKSTTAPRQGVAWLVGPDPGSSATGTSSVFYTPQTSGTASVPTIVQPTATDGYTLQAPTVAYLGSGFTTRQFPQQAQSGTTALASVLFYELHFPIPSDPNVNVTFAAMPSVLYTFQECQIDQGCTLQAGAQCSFVNCLSFHSTGYVVDAGGLLELFAGAASNGTSSGGPSVECVAGGAIAADLDFAQISAGESLSALGGLLEIGNVSHWGTSSQCVLATDGGQVIQAPIFGSTSIVYGSDGGTFVSVGAGTPFGGARYIYSQTGSGTPAADQFKSTNSSFLLGRGPSTSAWGISTSTGLAVGATTCTIANLDAAIGAGTGFGSQAVDPATMSYLGVNA